MSENRKRRIDQFFLFYSARADSWRNVAGVARDWAAGLVDKKAVEDAIADVAIIEEFHAFPGPAVMRTLTQLIETGDADAAASLIRRISEGVLFERETADTLETVADDGSEQDRSDLLPGIFSGVEHRRPFFEALFVTEQAPERWPALANELRRLRRREDQFIYEPVFVDSFEDAVCAAMVNPRIASVVTVDDLPYRSRYDAPALREILDPIVARRSGRTSGVDLARVLKGPTILNREPIFP